MTPVPVLYTAVSYTVLRIRSDPHQFDVYRQIFTRLAPIYYTLTVTDGICIINNNTTIFKKSNLRFFPSYFLDCGQPGNYRYIN